MHGKHQRAISYNMRGGLWAILPAAQRLQVRRLDRSCLRQATATPAKKCPQQINGGVTAAAPLCGKQEARKIVEIYRRFAVNLSFACSFTELDKTKIMIWRSLMLWLQLQACCFRPVANCHAANGREA